MNWVIKENVDNEFVSTLSKELNISPILSSMLIKRDIKTFDQAKTFFRPNFEMLHDPFLMKDMSIAVERIQKAVEKKESIMIFGDYDVDGTSSVALLSLYLESLGLCVTKYLPDRKNEGYGISINAIDNALKKKQKLIIALDCGIKAHKQVEYAKKKGIEFIICDHHNPEKNIPKALAVLNPKRKDCGYPYKELCGCGVGFKLVQAIESRHSNDNQIINYLDLVALAIAADVVPLTGENRVLAFIGLQIINSNPKLGIHCLLKKNIKKEYTISDLMYYVGPRINAAGRIKHASLALELLMCNEINSAEKLALEIDELNTSRREIEKDITNQAIDQVENSSKKLNSIVVFDSDWNKGVIGIVASRLVDKYYKPSIVFCESSEGFLTASARSIKGLDLYSVISQCKEYIDQFGGHKYAAGLTIKKENLEGFKKRFENIVSQTIDNNVFEQELLIESKINLSEITPKFFRILKQFEPFGPGNKSPVFLSENLQIKGKPLELGKEKEHIKLNLTQDNKNSYSSIGFWFSNKFNNLENKENFSAVFNIDENNWKDRSSIQLKLKDLK
ncbi:MAG: single-stranded-DNA-specific exonuclease RecJ [Flavobacteriales bacterium]|nr:single-stranded-DNA-specific exonuclease RecJ [Flavobacteriaceae bacterium]RZP08921.1 MAG: single-stranded-DNA-specific exonuclease RecJ [Flavobacteriales bacterium]